MMKRSVLAILAMVLTFALGSATASELLLGPGDVVKVSVYGNQDLQVETRVSEAGNITFPLIGQVQIGGLPTAAAERKIAGLLESGGFVRKPQVNLIVTLLQSQQISVVGQVNRPGRYPVDGKRTLLDVLAMAGGVGPDGGDLVSILRKREGKTIKEVVDVVDIFHSGKLDMDFDVNANDVVFVERAPRFYIYGEVQRPGVFRLERQMTVLQALSAGGGLSQRGTERNIRIKRRDDAGKLQIFDAQHDDLLRPDDVVYVKESWF